MATTSTVRFSEPKPASAWSSSYLVSVGAGVGVLALGWFLVVQPVWNDVPSSSAVATLDQAKLAVQTETEKLATLQEQYQALSATDTRRLDIVLPNGPDVPSLLAQLEGLINQNKLKVTDLIVTLPQAQATVSRAVRNEEGTVVGVTPLEQGTSQPVSTLQINLTLGAATYDQLKQFIATTEQSMRLLTLTSLSFSLGTTGASGGYVMNFTSPYFKPAQ